LGRSLAVCARLAERLDRFELGEMTSIRTFQFISKPREGDNRPPMKKVKMVIKIRRTEKYYELVDVDNL
jgi:hypothetical protein